MSFYIEQLSADLISSLQARYMIFPNIILRLNLIDKQFPCTPQERGLARYMSLAGYNPSQVLVCVQFLLCHCCAFDGFIPACLPFFKQLVANTGHFSFGSCCAYCADLSLQPRLGTFLLVAVRKTHTVSILG